MDKNEDVDDWLRPGDSEDLIITWSCIRILCHWKIQWDSWTASATGPHLHGYEILHQDMRRVTFHKRIVENTTRLFLHILSRSNWAFQPSSFSARQGSA